MGRWPVTPLARFRFLLVSLSVSLCVSAETGLSEHRERAGDIPTADVATPAVG